MSLSVVIFLLASTICLGQIGGTFGRGDPLVPAAPLDLGLLRDLPPKEPPTKSQLSAAPLPAARYQIVAVNGHILLFDSATGDTWALTETEKEKSKLTWSEVPRVASQHQAPRAEGDRTIPGGPLKPVEEDPFR
jgi:hypothetical protein